MNVRVRELTGIRALAPTTPSESDLALINSVFALRPLSAEDIHVREARICHNYHDRTGERFQKAQLERFEETLPHKSMLIGHDTRTAPVGRWFRADTKSRNELFPVLQVSKKEVGGGSAKGVEVIPGFEPQNVRVTWLEAGVYFVNDPATELQRKNIDAGVWPDDSIGFSFDRIDCDICKSDYLGSKCPHIFMRWDEDAERLATGTYSGDPKIYEARETSVVYLGAQQQAEFVKALRTGNVNPKALAQTSLGEDLVALKYYEHMARRFGHQQKTWAFPALDVSSSIDEDPAPSVDGESTTPAALAVNGDNDMDKKKLCEKLSLPETATEDEILAAVEKAKTDCEAAQAKAQESVPDAAQVAATEKLSGVGTAALADLQKAILDDDLKVSGKADNTELGLIVEHLVEVRDYDRLKKLAGEKRAQVWAKFPAEAVGQVDVDQETAAAPLASQRAAFTLA